MSVITEVTNLICRAVSKMHDMIRYGAIESDIDDTDPVRQIADVIEEGNGGKISQNQIISLYGLSAKPPKGTRTIRFMTNGHANNKVSLAIAQEERFKNLEDGEVVVFNPVTRAYIKFSENGNITIETTGNVEVKANEVNIDATKVNLGTGGQPIARVGDSVDVGGNPGTITSGGANTSI